MAGLDLNANRGRRGGGASGSKYDEDRVLKMHRNVVSHLLNVRDGGYLNT